MKTRIAIWACIGLVVAGGWALYAFVTPPEQFVMAMRNPLVEAIAFASCPVSFAGRYFPISLWWALALNAATYAVIGALTEFLHRKSNPRTAV